MADVVVEKDRRDSSGPIAAIVTILVLLLLGYLAWQYFGAGNPADTTNVEVNTPATQLESTTETNTTQPTSDDTVEGSNTATPETTNTDTPQ